MTTMTQTRFADATDAITLKRIRGYKTFLVLTMLNNALLAFTCLARGGGSAFAHAPEWAAPILGILGLVTIASAVLAMRWQRIGVVGVVACGALAVIVSVGAHLSAGAALFFVGTAVFVLVARHQWARMR